MKIALKHEISWKMLYIYNLGLYTDTEKHVLLTIVVSEIHQPQSPNERFQIRQQQCSSG